MKWTYLATAPDQPTAEMWLMPLLSDGIPATLVSQGDGASTHALQASSAQGDGLRS